MNWVFRFFKIFKSLLQIVVFDSIHCLFSKLVRAGPYFFVKTEIETSCLSQVHSLSLSMCKKCMLIIKLCLLILIWLYLQINCSFIWCFLDFACWLIFIICFFLNQRHAPNQWFQYTVIIERIFRTVAQTLAVIILPDVINFFLLDRLHLPFLIFNIIRIFIQWYIFDNLILSYRLPIIRKHNLNIRIRFLSTWVSICFYYIIIKQNLVWITTLSEIIQHLNVIAAWISDRILNSFLLVERFRFTWW